MKIAVSSTNKALNAKVADVFGRCPYFIIAEIKNKKIEKFEAIKNKNTEQMSGAGVLSSQLIAEKDVQIVITKNIGPRALDVLNQFNIKVYSGEGVIKQVLEELIDNKLEKIN